MIFKILLLNNVVCNPDEAIVTAKDDAMEPTSTSVIQKQNQTRDESHPLLRVLDTAPHSLTLRIKPRDFKPDTMVRLLYERVPQNKGPFMLHLDDPVIEYIPLIRRSQTHTLEELPMGKYIVCGEALLRGEVYQTSCFETSIRRLDTNSELRI